MAMRGDGSALAPTAGTPGVARGSCDPGGRWLGGGAGSAVEIFGGAGDGTVGVRSWRTLLTQWNYLPAQLMAPDMTEGKMPT